MRRGRWISAIVVASLLFLGLQPTVAQAAVGQADLFSTSAVTQIELTIPQASETSLNNRNTAKNYVAAQFKVTLAGQTIGPIDVGIRLKGSTSLELLNQRPSFKVAFNWKLLKGNRLLGLKNLTLNAMTQDNSKLHEFGAYKMFNAMGVPAPRTGWNTLKINGANRGLYLTLETVDDIFANNRYRDITGHIYEAIALNDLKPGNSDGAKDTGHYLVKEGWTANSNKNDLAKLITAANTNSLSSWWSKMAAVADRTQLVKMWAVENFTGHWDSYSGPLQNNHFLRSNNQGKFTMIPWGTDQTFGENKQTSVLLDDYFFPLDKPQSGFPWVQQAFHKATMDRGLLFRKCLAYKPCKTLYLTQLKAVSAKATAIKLTSSMRAAGTMLSNYTDEGAKAEQNRVVAWIGKQQARVKAVLKANGIR